MKYSDSRIVIPRLSKPVSFAALMALYESNYIQLMRFLNADRKHIDYGEATIRYDKHAVHCRIEDVTTYTSLVCIDEDLFDQGEPVRINHFRIRLYHDALCAAVTSSIQENTDYQLKSLPLNQSRLRVLWQQNMFLNKWLAYCLSRKLVFTGKIDENTDS
ncbi:MAG: DUF1249 domain-containing protein [Gammaproteobacteria bacterium]|nr:DUF1249 domain-containing protein [Gammaproteobacteria bacterium]NNC98398.1 DUF1249 domain-containing protein [Gammaproteobacteria bacterium]NNM13066.1 DUF1249 domain-containing protein [Gammaproteobacteria bacterium]